MEVDQDQGVPEGWVVVKPEAAVAEPSTASPWTAQFPKTAAGVKAVVNTIPAAGAMVGGVLSTPETGGVGTVPGMALGYGVGQGLRDLLAQGLGLETSTPTEKAKRIVVGSVETALASSLIPGLWTAIRTPGKTVREVVDMIPAAMRPKLPPPLEKSPAAILERPAWQTWHDYIPDPEVNGATQPARALTFRGPNGQQIAIDPATPQGLDTTRAIRDAYRAAEPAISETAPSAASQFGPRAVVPSPQMIRNQLGIAARRAQLTLTPEIEAAATDLMRKGSTATDALTQAASASKPVLSAGEVKLMQAMRRQGASDAEVQAALKAARAFNEKFGLTTPSRADTLFPKGMRGKPSGAGGLRQLLTNEKGELVIGTSTPPVEAPAEPLTIKAYHGSPHDFEQFSAEKIGTGEGAQAYGHGLYFAESPAVAEAYKKALSDFVIETPTGNIGGNFMPVYTKTGKIDQALAWVQDAASKGVTDPFATGAAQARIAGRAMGRTEEYEAVAQQIEHWKSVGARIKPGGRTYEVAIKAHPDQFLDWDKPLSQQSEAVRNALLKTMREHAPKLTDAWEKSGALEQAPVGALYRGLENAETFSKGPAFAGGDTGNLGRAGLSGALKDAGIPGIKYLDAGSRAAGEGSRNFVVFPGNEHLIDILKKYGLSISTLGGWMKLQQAKARQQKAGS